MTVRTARIEAGDLFVSLEVENLSNVGLVIAMFEESVCSARDDIPVPRRIRWELLSVDEEGGIVAVTEADRVEVESARMSVVPGGRRSLRLIFVRGAGMTEKSGGWCVVRYWASPDAVPIELYNNGAAVGLRPFAGEVFSGGFKVRG